MATRSCPDPTCGIARSLDLLGERWALLVVRDAFFGSTRFSDFRASLGVSPDILTARLTSLVEAGVMERSAYREPGERERAEYHLTSTGRELVTVLASLGRWGADHYELESGPRTRYTDAATGEPVRLAFVTPAGRTVAPADVSLSRASVAAR